MSDDEQDLAEMYDEESLGDDEPRVEPEPADGRLHGHLAAPDAGGNDGTAELVATEYPEDGDPLSPEERAMHTE